MDDNDLPIANVKAERVLGSASGLVGGRRPGSSNDHIHRSHTGISAARGLPDAVDVPDSPPKKRIALSSVAKPLRRQPWQGFASTAQYVKGVTGAHKCMASALCNLAALSGNQYGDIVDACFDDEDGPFSFKRCLEKCEHVQLGAAIYSRGYGPDRGCAADLKRWASAGGEAILALGDHAVGLRSDNKTVIVADSCSAWVSGKPPPI